MDIITDIRKRAKSLKHKVVLPETNDRRVLEAAALLYRKKLAGVILVGRKQKVHKIAEVKDVVLPDGIQFIDPEEFSQIGILAENFSKRQKLSKLSIREAHTLLLANPLYFGAALVANGSADACVAGSVSTTGEVIRAAIKVIGLKKDNDIVSSFFLMVLSDGKTVTYADCGVVPYPNKQQLANIAIETARNHQLLTGQEPRIGMLSFSTRGSAVHERVKLVRQATEIVRQKAPGLLIDGELQFDTAVDPDVARRKAPDSSVAGKVNVFVFPNLDAGNIGYKITERLGKATATGPILQGLVRPMTDLSRGCSSEDIVNAACVSILLGENGPG